MNYLLVEVVLALLAAQEAPAERVRWLLENAVAVRSIAPDDEDFADLEPLVELIGDARIVQLGEQSHGDGATFHAKCRLVRFLHQRLGFDVLAWESGLYDCAVMEEKLHEEIRTDAAANWGVFPIWGASEQVLPVFRYARSTHGGERPLEMAGFDCQFSSRAADGYQDHVLAFFDGIDPALIDDAARRGFKKAFRRLFEPPWRPSPEQLVTDQAAIRTLEGLLAPPAPRIAKERAAREIAFLERTLRNFAVQSELRAKFAAEETRLEASNLRDRVMGENVVWLADEYYAGRRIIVWAASRHVARNLRAVDARSTEFSYADYVTEGDGVHATLDEAVYTILFTAARGSAAIVRRDPVDLDPPEAGSLEDLCQQTGKPYLFIDLRGERAAGGAWLDAPLCARPFGYLPGIAPWPRVCDAIFFIETMYPSTTPEDDESGR